MIWTRYRTVYFGDDDASGLIYFPSYAQYMSEGEQEAFTAIGYPIEEQVAQRLTAPAVHVEYGCLSPARAGDRLAHRIILGVGRRSSMICEHEFHLGEVTVARGRIVRAFVDLDSMRSVEVPAAIRAALAGEHAAS